MLEHVASYVLPNRGARTSCSRHQAHIVNSLRQDAQNRLQQVLSIINGQIPMITDKQKLRRQPIMVLGRSSTKRPGLMVIRRTFVSSVKSSRTLSQGL